MTLIAPHIGAFLRERLPVDKGASVHTCESYAYAFKLLIQYASNFLKIRPCELQFEQLDEPLILQFLAHLETQRGNGRNSRNVRLAAIRSFMHFMETRLPSSLEQIRRVLAIPSKKAESRLIRHLSVDEVQAILNAPSPSELEGIRDRAMLYLCLGAALRVSELVGLKLTDLVLQPEPMLVVNGKGRRQRCLPLWKETVVALRAWLSLRPAAPVPELFLSARGQPMSRAGFEYILDKHVSAAAEKCPSLREKRVSPHVLRHTAALVVLQATKDLRKVSLWLGHASMQTTEMYTRVDPSEKLEVLASVVVPKLRSGKFKATDELIESLNPKTFMRSPKTA